jgi:uncharacterized protein YciI
MTTTQTDTFLYTLRPSRLAMLAEGPTPEEAATVQRHFAYLQDLTAQGVVILAGRTLTTDADSFGIVILRAASEAAAQAVLEADPAVAGGVMHARLFPYRIALPPEAAEA